MMRLKLLVNKLAVICGSVSSDITNTIPTMRRHDTMVSAMNIMRRYSNKATGRCCERANSLSKAMAMIALRNKPKNTANITLSMPSMAMSLVVMVRILPNRYDDKSGVKPGAKKLNMIPIAIPKVQNTAMAESSRISLRLLSHSTPKADSTENIAAHSMGDTPAYNPMPIPPKEAWVMPPLMNTNRRVTMYVPIIPHAMLANKLPKRACWKNVY